MILCFVDPTDHPSAPSPAAPFPLPRDMYNSTKREGGYLIRLIQASLACSSASTFVFINTSYHLGYQPLLHRWCADMKNLIFILSVSNVSIDHDMNGSLAVEVTAIVILHHF